jgi:hypothetical protein
MNNKKILEILNGRTVIRGKITFSLIVNYLQSVISFSPKEIHTQQSLDSLWFRISKIDRLFSELISTKEFRKKAYKKAIESLYLDKNKEKENLEIIDVFMKEIETSNKEYIDMLENDLKDLKDRLNMFLSSDISKTEKVKFLRNILGEYHDFILLQLEKEREVQLPIGKFEVKVHSRFNTKNVSFDLTKSLKDILMKNSDVKVEELEQQRELIKKHILDEDKHLDRLKKD